MAIIPVTQYPKIENKVDRTTLEQVKMIKYLEKMIKSDGRSETAIRQRIEMAIQA